MLVYVHFIFKGTNITLFRHVQNKPKIHLPVCNKFEANLGKHGNLQLLLHTPFYIIGYYL